MTNLSLSIHIYIYIYISRTQTDFPSLFIRRTEAANNMGECQHNHYANMITASGYASGMRQSKTEPADVSCSFLSS